MARKAKGAETGDPVGRLLSDESIADFTPRQRELLEAALRVMSAKGYDGSRTREIAETAGVSEATLFKNFPTKRDILMALMKPFLATVVRPSLMASVKRVIEASADASLEDTLREIFRDRVALIRARGPLITTLVLEAIRHDELREIVQKQVMPEIVTMIDGVLGAAETRGEIAPRPRRAETRFILSAVLGYVVLGGLFPDQLGTDDDATEIDSLVQLVLHGLKGG
jgi:AcrR family transcriptional regulator